MRPRSPHIASLALGIYAAVTGTLAVAAALFASNGGLDPIARFAWIAAASIIALGSLLAIAGVWSATGAYAAVFGCFHFGLVVLLAVGYIAPADLSLWDESWVLSPFAAEAAGLALAGSLAFASGACLIYSRRVRVWMSDRQQNGREPVHPHSVAGSVLVFGAIAVWCGIVISTGGVTGFFGSYEEYLQMTSDSGAALAIIWLVLGCGTVLSVTGRPTWHRTAALIALGCFSLVALPLGLRSEVMFPAVAMLIALARCGRAITPLKAGAVGLLLLLVVPIVRDLRATGLRALFEAELTPPGLDALAEMGGSLHPVEKVVRWHSEGEAFEWGASYWAPFERAAAKLLPGLADPAAEDDLRLMNVLVLDRIGAIGFSPVAEAYRNFGPLGVVIVLGLLGMVMGAIDTIGNPHTAVLAIATLFVPLLINVRNSFVSVPAQCVAGVLIVTAVAGTRHVVGSILARPYARATDIRSEV